MPRDNSTALAGDFFNAPVLTVLSRPTFEQPVHLPVSWHDDDVDDYVKMKLTVPDGQALIEFAGRLCYMSQHNPADRTNREYIDNLRKQGHGSVLEHANYSVLFEGVSRSFTHELVRHRAGWAYSQLSQRYVDEEKTQFVIPPAILDASVTDRGQAALEVWKETMRFNRDIYHELSEFLYSTYGHIADKTHRRKTAREAARSVLPNATETKIVATANIRAWRTMLELRCGEGAEREMRRAMVTALQVMTREAPACFSDFTIYTASDGFPAARVEHHKV